MFSVGDTPQPRALADALFNAVSFSRRGAITFEEFICALAVMHQGNAREQLRMLFEVLLGA